MNNSNKSRQEFKIQRVRLNPTKKWTEHEEKLLIEFLLQNKTEFESPTAQVFYKRFCKEKQLNIEWKLVRSKVRNMRMSYNKTRFSLESTDGDIEGSRTVKRCNHYDELDMIFSELYADPSNTSEQYKPNRGKNSIAESDDSNTAASERSDLDGMPTSSTNNCGVNFNLMPQPAIIKTEFLCSSEPTLMPAVHNDIDNNINTPSRELSIEERKLALEEKKVLLKEKKLNSEEKIKIYKINSREKLKIIELEMQERLALEELKLKYK